MAVNQPELDFPRKGEADLFGAEALADGDLFAAAPPAATGATGTAAAVIAISASASGNVRVAGAATLFHEEVWSPEPMVLLHNPRAFQIQQRALRA